MIFWWRFPHNINIMEISSIIFICFFTCSNDTWSRNSRLCCFLCENSPVKLFLIEITKSVFRHSVSYANIYSIRRQNSMHFIQHSFGVRPWIITTKYWVKTCLVYYCIECSIIELQTSGIHLLENHLRNLLFIVLINLFDYSKWNVYICYVLITIFKHFFAHLWVATA